MPSSRLRALIATLLVASRVHQHNLITKPAPHQLLIPPPSHPLRCGAFLSSTWAGALALVRPQLRHGRRHRGGSWSASASFRRRGPTWASCSVARGRALRRVGRRLRGGRRRRPRGLEVSRSASRAARWARAVARASSREAEEGAALGMDAGREVGDDAAGLILNLRPELGLGLGGCDLVGRGLGRGRVMVAAAQAAGGGDRQERVEAEDARGHRRRQRGPGRDELRRHTRGSWLPRRVLPFGAPGRPPRLDDRRRLAPRRLHLNKDHHLAPPQPHGLRPRRPQPRRPAPVLQQDPPSLDAHSADADVRAFFSQLLASIFHGALAVDYWAACLDVDGASGPDLPEGTYPATFQSLVLRVRAWQAASDPARQTIHNRNKNSEVAGSRNISFVATAGLLPEPKTCCALCCFCFIRCAKAWPRPD